MIAERAAVVVVLAVDVVGNGAADGGHLGARHDRQAPAARDHQALDVAQQDARLADQPAVALVESDQAVERGRAPQHAAGVEAFVAVAAARAVGDARLVAGQRLGDAVAVGQLDDLVRQGGQTAPGRHRPHVAPPKT